MRTDSKNLRIVLTDDDAEDCDLFREALGIVDPNVVLEIVHNGRELLDHLHHTPAGLPHLVLLDLNMPVMDGMECMAALRGDHRLRDLTVVIFTTSSSGHDIERSRGAGANGYICKPACFQKLREVIGLVLDTDWKREGKPASGQFHIAL